MALALNRYLCLAVLPLITKCAPLFAGTEHRAIMVDSMLHTVYRLSRGRSLTKAQRDVIEECLMALCRWGGARWAEPLVGGPWGEITPPRVCPRRYIRPSMLQHLLRRLVFDVPILNEFAKMPLKVRASPLQLAYFRAPPTALLCNFSVSHRLGRLTCKCSGSRPHSNFFNTLIFILGFPGHSLCVIGASSTP